MIGSLRGRLLRVDEGIALIEVSGTGYEVEMPESSLNEIGKTDSEVFVYIHHSVREDAHVLYGFSDYTARALFRVLIKVSGIGPKTALAALSTFDVPSFVAAVLQEQVNSLIRIPGVGKKSAERMIVELKDRLGRFNSESPSSAAKAKNSGSQAVFDEAVSALVNLGYRESDAVRAVSQEAGDGMDTGAIVVAALKLLSKK